MKNNETLVQLIALKEQIEDIIDQLQSPDAEENRSSAKTASRSSRRRAPASAPNKLAIVVGHTASQPGAQGIDPIGAAEYPWNTDLASKIAAEGSSKGVNVKIFLRDQGGIAAAYAAVAEWGARAAIELHFNAADGTARGTETLYGEACSDSFGWADAIQKAMVSLYSRTGTKNRGLKKCPPHPRGGASVNALGTIPSCLIEPFFGDNSDDATLGQNKKLGLATALVDTFKARFGV